MADTAAAELLAHLRAAVALCRDLECQADLPRDPEMLHAVRDQANALGVMLHAIGRQAPGRTREGAEQGGE